MKKRLAEYRLPPLGIVLVVVGVAALVVAGVGPASAQLPAFIVATVIGASVVAGSGVGGRGMGRGWRERRGEFDPQNRSNATPPDDADDVEAWDRERERYRNRR